MGGRRGEKSLGKSQKFFRSLEARPTQDPIKRCKVKQTCAVGGKGSGGDARGGEREGGGGIGGQSSAKGVIRLAKVARGHCGKKTFPSLFKTTRHFSDFTIRICWLGSASKVRESMRMGHYFLYRQIIPRGVSYRSGHPVV